MNSFFDKLWRWSVWTPNILIDLILHFKRTRKLDTRLPVKNIFFVPYDEFYFFKFDLLLANFCNVSLGKSVVLTTPTSKFIKLYCKFVGLECHRLGKPLINDLLEAKKIFKLFEEYSYNKKNKTICKDKSINYEYRGIPYGKFITSDVLGRYRTNNYQDMFIDPVIKKGVIERIALSIVANRQISERFNQAERIFFNEKNFLPANLIAFNQIGRIRVFEWKPTPKKAQICIKEFLKDNFFSHPFGINLSKAKFEEKLSKFNKKSNPHTRLKSKYNNYDWYGRDVLLNSFIESEKSIQRNDKPIVGIFPHINWDATFSYGKNYFTDYKELFSEIYNIIPEFPDINFVVKFHPDYQFKNKQSNKIEEADIEDELKFLRGQKNVTIFEPSNNINISYLLKKVSSVITVRGTIGIEAALLGKTVIVFGTGRYSDYGFTKMFKNVESLRNHFRRTHGLNVAASDVTKRAALYWDELYEKTPIDLKEFLDFKSNSGSVSHPLKLNYIIKHWIDKNHKSAKKILRLVQ